MSRPLKDVFDEIKHLAEFHSKTIATITGTKDGHIDWKENQVITLAELDTILNEIIDTDKE